MSGALLIDIAYSAVITAFLSYGFFLTLKYARVYLMSYGEIVLLGGYISTFQQPSLGGWAISLLLAALGGSALGVVTFLLLRRLFERGRAIESLLLTWGTALILMESFRILMGPAGRFAPPFLEGAAQIAGEPFPYLRLLALATILVLALLLLGAIRLLDRRGRLSALAFGHRVALDYGVPVPWLLLATITLSCAVACVAGVVLGQEAAITPYGGVQYTIIATLAALVAGPRLMSGLLVAGALAGLRTWLGYTVGLTPAWLIVLLIAVLGASLRRGSVVLHDSA
jgi:branched-subunit amino acid ABC-type transport system permease component